MRVYYHVGKRVKVTVEDNVVEVCAIFGGDEDKVTTEEVEALYFGVVPQGWETEDQFLQTLARIEGKEC